MIGFSTKNLLLATIVIMLVALTLGCSKKPDVVGIWQNTNVRELIEFKSDNSGTIQGKNLSALKFNWKETAQHTYKLDVDFQGTNKSLKALVQDTTMTLEGEGGTESYRKVPAN